MERWFGFLTDQMIRRSVHKSVVALENDVRTWIDNWNQDPKPFVKAQDRGGDPRLPHQIYGEDSRTDTLVRRGVSDLTVFV